MSSGANETDLNEIDLEALRWLALMQHGPLPAQEQLRFQAWVAADTRHKGALIRARAASLRLDRLAALAGGRSIVQPPSQRELYSPRYMTRRRMMVAAALLGGVGVWLGRERIEDRWGGTRYACDVGELKTFVLEDGSVVTLNTGSELRVRYTNDRRDIRLIRGEAMFTVAHDAKRPFGVRIDDWSAQALGTAFAVRRLDEETTDITVTEGVVQMLPLAGNVSKTPPPLAANQKARIGAGGTIEISAVSASDLAAQLAWRNHLVVFSGVSLREALAEMNRYSPRRIVIADPELAQRRVVGVFSTLDTQTFVSALQSTLGVEAVISRDTVLLRPVN
jgi:transmembrane sensor